MIEKKEFIGKKAEIHYNKKVYEGIIIDETKNMLRLETKDKAVWIIKRNAAININQKNIDGKKITKRPEDRIKAC